MPLTLETREPDESGRWGDSRIVDRACSAAHQHWICATATFFAPWRDFRKLSERNMLNGDEKQNRSQMLSAFANSSGGLR